MNDVVFFSSDSYKGEERLRLNLWKLLIIWHVSTVIIKRMAAGTSCSSLLTLCECMYHKDIKKKNSKIDISFTNEWWIMIWSKFIWSFRWFLIKDAEQFFMAIILMFSFWNFVLSMYVCKRNWWEMNPILRFKNSKK